MGGDGYGRDTPRINDAIAARPSLAGAKAFVAVIFTILGAAFVLSTALLYSEFRNHDWSTLALTHSHLFVFFPTFGLLALAAFHLPSAVFVHLYWYTVPFGKWRFLHGFVWAAVIAWGVSHFLLGEWASPRQLWEVSPKTMDLDRGAAVPCPGGVCSRVPIGDALQSLRKGASTEVALAKLGRNCKADDLVEPPEDFAKDRWCVPAGKKLTAPDCCRVQRATSDYVSVKYGEGTPRSNLARWDAILQPLKVFFIVVVMVIGILLLIWRVRIQRVYPDLARRIDWHVMIGASALLLWPIMDYAYQDAANALYGRWTGGMQLRLSLVVGPWLAIILYYFLQRFSQRVEVLGQLLGVAGGLLAFLARDELRDAATKMTGVGMPFVMVLVLAALLLVGILALYGPRRWIPDAWRKG
jgi:hypothetical protein